MWEGGHGETQLWKLYYTLVAAKGNLMQSPGRRWVIHDRDGNPIYLTEERWYHIIEPNNHPEMADYEDHLRRTIQNSRRRQEPLNPHKYRYSQPFDDLPVGFNHVVCIVLFGFDVNARGETIPNNFIVTAFLKHMRLRGGSNDTHTVLFL